MESGDALGCPDCHGKLTDSGESSKAWRCRNCGRRFAQSGQMAVMLSEDEIARFGSFARKYREAHKHDSWQPFTPEQLLALPYGELTGQPALYWEVRRQTFCTLMDALAREGPTPVHGPAADLGAGTGWLSYRLAQLGYSVLAVDASRDAEWGLGAAEQHYLPHVRFVLAQGDLEHPPLQADTLALIIMNASLHYATDLNGTLCRVARALRPGGRLAVLDTPIARQPRPGTGLGDRHLGRQELHEALLAAGLTPCWIPVRRGAAWWLRQTKAWLGRDALFSFPMLLADRLL